MNKLRVGDSVKVITGKYKGKLGKVKKINWKSNSLIVEGVNMAKKSIKPSQVNPSGGFLEIERPLDVSNVILVNENGVPVNSKMIFDSATKKMGRVLSSK